MKKLGLLALLLTNASAYALNPVQGWYGGILLGINYTPSTNFVIPATFTSILTPIVVPADGTATLKYGTMGQIAGQVGYRCGKYRVEAQLGYNNSPVKSLTIDDTTITIPSNNKYFTSSANTNTGYGMINGYYDFLPTDPNSNIAPFLGLGIGYASTTNEVNVAFWYNNFNFQTLNVSEKTTSPAGQIMLGTSYFMDDFSTLALDLRYFTTSTKATVTNARVEVVSLNITFNGAFDFG